MLTRTDDYPVHQTSEPVAHAATYDRNFYDRYWFNGYHRDGDFIFGFAHGLYPNRHVADAHFTVVHEGVQHSVHASRRAPAERQDTTVGPLSVEVVEPLAVLRVRADENETGLTCDLTFTARTVAMEEDRMLTRQGSVTVMDTTRLTQLGVWEGWVQLPTGARLEVHREQVLGTRDRSWGVRPVGEPAGGAPNEPGTLLWLWLPVHFDDAATLWGSFERRDGEMWHKEARRVAALPFGTETERRPDAPSEARVDPITPVGHELTFAEGSRRVTGGTFRGTGSDGKDVTWAVEVLPQRFHLSGIGYSHPDWGHGTWQGELEVGGDRWSLDDVDTTTPKFLHFQQVVRVTEESSTGTRQGMGVLEQIFVGPHDRYGFTSFLDGTRG